MSDRLMEITQCWITHHTVWCYVEVATLGMFMLVIDCMIRKRSFLSVSMKICHKITASISPDFQLHVRSSYC